MFSIFSIFFVCFRILVSGEDSGCMLGWVLGFSQRFCCVLHRAQEIATLRGHLGDYPMAFLEQTEPLRLQGEALTHAQLVTSRFYL